MRLLSLNIVGFRQHLSTGVWLANGLSGIIGANGSGKSSLVEAIAFALYGSKAIRGKIDDVKTRGHGKDLKPEVSLLFELGEKVFRVDRTFSDAALYFGGEPQPIAQGHRDVNSRIGHLLGMQYDEFVAAFYTEQKGLEFLSGKKGAAERERFIVRMMGYDKLEKVQELLRAERRDKKNELLGRSAALGNEQEFKDRIELERRKLAELDKSRSEAAAALERAERDYDRKIRDFKSLEKQAEIFDKHSRALEALQIRRDERAKQLAQYEQVRGKLLKETPEIANLLRQKDSQPSVAGNSSQLLELRDKQKSLLEKLRASESEMQRTIARAESEVERCEQLYLDAENYHKGLIDLDSDGNCPTCGQELGDSFLKVCASATDAVATCLKRLSSAKQNLQDNLVEPQIIVKLRGEIKENECKLQSVQSEQQRFTEISEKVREFERISKELEIAMNEHSELAKHLEEAQDRIGALGFSLDKFNSEKSALAAAQRLVEVARLQKVRSEGEHNTAMALLERSERELDQFYVAQQAMKEGQARLILLEESDEALTQFRKYLNAAIRPRLAELASEFLSDLTDGRYTTVEIEEDFAPTVLDESGPKPIISGGEEDILNLCVRLALSHMLVERSGQALSLLILDEVFGSLDEHRRSNVIGLLEKLSNRFEQILVITHFDDLKEAVQNLIYIDYEDATGVLKVTDEGSAREEQVLNL